MPELMPWLSQMFGLSKPTNSDPEPRRGVQYSVEDITASIDTPNLLGQSIDIHVGYRWQCLICESGKGADPMREGAANAAENHIRNSHSLIKETT